MLESLPNIDEFFMKCNIVCFIGHRRIIVTDYLVASLTMLIESLIIKGVTIFLFGSRSDFDNLCYEIVTKLKEKYPDIKRVFYSCKNETCTLEYERLSYEQLYSKVLKREVHIRGFEEEFDYKTKFSAGKASYVERNKAMIDESDIIICYYDENYLPPKRTARKRDVIPYQPKSGTEIAFKYAKQKKKTIINVFDDRFQKIKIKK